MLPNNPASLLDALRAAENLSGRVLVDVNTRIALGDLANGTVLYGRAEELRGRSVLLTTREQVTTAAALIELDGLAGRIVICPPDLPLQYFAYVIETAEIDAIVSDRTDFDLGRPRPLYFSPCTRRIEACANDRVRDQQTEWVLFTSGTTGLPKLAVHTLKSLTGAIQPNRQGGEEVIWSTFYDIRRYGGLQIFLRAALTGSSLVLSTTQQSTAEFLEHAAVNQVTHISGTPSHWRRALMSPTAKLLQPRYVRLSGEIADQGILNHLRSFYPNARMSHAFASTEAGVAFEVNDDTAGFPAGILESTPDVEMKVEDGTLRIRSARTASRYLGMGASALKDEDGYVDTRDVVELQDGRYYFAGRRDGAINVGGLKVFPEEIESVINRHPEVHMSLVRTRKSSVTGALVVADVMLKPTATMTDRDINAIQNDILSLCRSNLSSHKVPAMISFVPDFNVAESGKVMRRNA